MELSKLQQKKLIFEIKNNAMKYNFFQLVHLIEKIFSPCSLSDNSITNSIKFIPTKELMFSSTDVKKCHVDENNFIKIGLAFLNIYKSDLSLFFCLEKENDKKALYDFLDKLNNRIYVLFYLSWKKYHPFITSKKRYEDFILYLSGYNACESKNKLLLSLFGGFHNLINLENMIINFLKLQVRITQFLPRWIEVKKGKLGKDKMVLGDNVNIGEHLLCFYKISIQVGPMQKMQAVNFLKNKYIKLKRLVSEYLNFETKFNVKILLNMKKIDSLSLKLGKSIYIGI